MQRSLVSSAVKSIRSAAPIARGPIAKAPVRNLSGGHGANDLVYWKNISYGGLGFAALLTGFQYYVHVQHHASGAHFDPELNKYPYMHTRNKAYPWSCPDCSLFDQKCWDACKGRGGGHH